MATPPASSFLPPEFLFILQLQEATIRDATARYQKVSNTVQDGHDTERAAFNMVIRELETCTAGRSRVKALGRNHTLWSLLVQDLALAENRLPDGLKSQLTSLGLWSMRYSTMAMLKDMPIAPLLEVNRNVVSGLAAQRTNAENGAAHTQPRDQTWKAPHSA